VSFWDRFRRLYRETTPPASDYLSRLATIRRELDALVEELGESASEVVIYSLAPFNQTFYHRATRLRGRVADEHPV